jgi:O-methyltransferase
MKSPMEYAEQIAYSSRDTLYFTLSMAVRYKDSPGVYCECGVAAGAQVIAMAYGAPNKIIYAFDSFQGIPLPSNRDDQMPGIMKLTETEMKMLPDPGKQVLESSGATSVSKEEFIKHLVYSGVKYDNIQIVRGWFEDTLVGYTDDHHHLCEISILRLDGDLYNSTWVCLEHLFPKVIKGGIVILDDFELKGCREAAEDYFKLIGYEPKYIHEPITHFFK